MNRDALRVSAPNRAVQPVRGAYGAVRVASRRRAWPALRPRGFLVALLILSGGLAAYVFLPDALAPKPTLRIVSPQGGAALSDPRVAVTVEVENATLSASDLHLHYYLDAIVPTAHDRAAIPTTGSWASSTRTTHSWDLATPGLHILAVQLVTADDRPLRRPVVAAVTVYAPKPPAPESASPTPTSSYKDGGR